MFSREPRASATAALARGSRLNFFRLLDFTSRIHYHACLVPPRLALSRETAWALHPPSAAAASRGVASSSAPPPLRSQKTLAQNDQRFLLSLPQAIVAWDDEVEEVEIAEDLQLLADFVADVPILGMKSCQRGGVAVYVGESEFGLA